MEAYKLWVRQNRQLIASLENIANTATWFLPERFTSSEIGTEAVAAILGLMTVLNQHIIDTSPQLHSQAQFLPDDVSARAQQQRCISLASILSAVKQLEILVEVTAEHYKGREKKWTMLAAMEAIKACLRFLMLHQNGYRMLLLGGEAIHTEDMSGASVARSSFRGASTERAPGGRQMRPTSSPGTRNGFISGNLETKATVALMKFGQNVGVNSKPSWAYHRHQDNLESSTRTSNVPCVPKPPFSRNWELPDELLVLGEWIFILRPLVYVLLIRRYGLKSWKPWLASLALDGSGLTTILASAFLKDRKQLCVLRDGHDCVDRPPFSDEEVQEVKRRQLLLVLYLTRDPFFSKYTRGCLSGAERALRPVPLLGSLGGKVVDFVTGIQARYCYTSGS
eukprot:c11527_g1_i2 orf=151-1335(+)